MLGGVGVAHGAPGFFNALGGVETDRDLAGEIVLFSKRGDTAQRHQRGHDQAQETNQRLLHSIVLLKK